MLFKKLLFDLRFEFLQTLFPAERRFECIECIRPIEFERHRGITAIPVEGILQLVIVSPEFGIESAPACIEPSDNSPLISAEGNSTADLRPDKIFIRCRTGYNFPSTGTKHPAFHDMELRAQDERLLCNTPDRNVAQPAAFFRQVDNDNRLARYNRFSVRILCDIGKRQHRIIIVPEYDAGDFSICRFPGNDNIIRHPGRDERLLNTVCKHKYGSKNKYDKRNACNGDRRGKFPRLEISQSIF